MKKPSSKGFVFGSLVLLAALVFIVSPGVGIFIYVDRHWGDTGILVIAVMVVVLGVFALTKTIDTLGNAANQRIWANVSSDNANNQGTATVQTMKALMGLLKHIEKQNKGNDMLPGVDDFDDFFAGIDGQGRLPMQNTGQLPEPSAALPNPWTTDTSSPADISDDLRIE